MATLVAACAVPHTPAFPKIVGSGVPLGTEIASMYAPIRAIVSDAAPDVILVLADDHLNTFFLDNFPALAIGVAETTWGPNDGTDGLDARAVSSHPGLAQHLLEHLTAGGFDFSSVREFAIDHAMVVPLHFLSEQYDTPMIPLWINELVPPIPTAARAYALGHALRAAIDSHPSELRVAIVASGSFSLEVGGVHIAPDANFGVPDPEWTTTVVDHLKAGTAAELIALATPERLHRAGNVGGELLAWLVVWATVDGRPPVHISVQPQYGHAYASWSVTP